MLAALHAEGLLDEETLREEHTDSATAVHGRRRGGRALRRRGRPCTTPGWCGCAPSDFRLVDDDGRAHPSRFAIGPHTNVRLPGAFTRPNTNALSFRANDALARAVLDPARRVRARPRAGSPPDP